MSGSFYGNWTPPDDDNEESLRPPSIVSLEGIEDEGFRPPSIGSSEEGWPIGPSSFEFNGSATPPSLIAQEGISMYSDPWDLDEYLEQMNNYLHDPDSVPVRYNPLRVPPCPECGIFARSMLEFRHHVQTVHRGHFMNQVDTYTESDYDDPETEFLIYNT